MIDIPDFELIEIGFGPIRFDEPYSVPVGTNVISFEIATGPKINDFGDRIGTHTMAYHRTDKPSFSGYPLFEARLKNGNRQISNKRSSSS